MLDGVWLLTQCRFENIRWRDLRIQTQNSILEAPERVIAYEVLEYLCCHF